MGSVIRVSFILRSKRNTPRPRYGILALYGHRLTFDLSPGWTRAEVVMASDEDRKFMARAIELSRKAGIVDRTGNCFGCVIVKDGGIVGEGYNQVSHPLI